MKSNSTADRTAAHYSHPHIHTYALLIFNFKYLNKYMYTSIILVLLLHTRAMIMTGMGVCVVLGMWHNLVLVIISRSWQNVNNGFRAVCMLCKP